MKKQKTKVMVCEQCGSDRVMEIRMVRVAINEIDSPDYYSDFHVVGNECLDCSQEVNIVSRGKFAKNVNDFVELQQRIYGKGWNPLK